MRKKHLLLPLEKLAKLEDMEALKYILDKIRPHILKTGVNAKSFVYVEEQIEKINEEKLKEAREFFERLYSEEWEQVRIAWNFLPEHAWNNWETLYGENNMPEHEHLLMCQKLLKKRWEQRPIKRKRRKNSSIKKKVQ